MILSRRCEYAIRAVLYLAAHAAEGPLPVRQVSRALGIPHAFLAKALRDLVQAGLITGQPGAGGGLGLARPAAAITLKDVVLAVEGPSLFEECVLRLPGCGHLQPCPLHAAWMQIRAQMDQMLSQSTLDVVTEAVDAGEFRLSDVVAGLPKKS